MTNRKSLGFLAESALIAALYLVLTVFTRFFGIADGAIQFRLSEALTILPVFTPAAIPGLTLGCFLASLGSPFGIADMLCGSLATLLAAVVTWLLRKITVAGLPVLSFFAPVFFNGVIVGALITLMTETGQIVPDAFRWTVFLSSAATVALGELVVCYGLGIPFYWMLKKADRGGHLFRR